MNLNNMKLWYKLADNTVRIVFRLFQACFKADSELFVRSNVLTVSVGGERQVLRNGHYDRAIGTDPY